MRFLKNPYFFLALSMLLWAGNILLGRGMHQVFTPSAMAFWRWSVALVLVVPFAGRGVWARREAVLRNWPLLALTGMLGTAVFQWMLYQALQTTTATNAALLYATTPIFIVAASWGFSREKITLRQGGGIALSTCGAIAVIARGDLGLLLSLRLTPGDLWALGTVPVWGVYTLLLRRRSDGLGPLQFQTVLAAFGLVLLAPLYLWERGGGPNVAWSPAAVATVAYLAVFASLAAFVLWNLGVEAIGANRAGLFTHLYPLFTALLAILFLGESLHPYHLAGMALIAAGLYLTTIAPRAPKAPA